MKISHLDFDKLTDKQMTKLLYKNIQDDGKKESVFLFLAAAKLWNTVCRKRFNFIKKEELKRSYFQTVSFGKVPICQKHMS